MQSIAQIEDIANQRFLDQKIEKKNHPIMLWDDNLWLKHWFVVWERSLFTGGGAGANPYSKFAPPRQPHTQNLPPLKSRALKFRPPPKACQPCIYISRYDVSQWTL